MAFSYLEMTRRQIADLAPSKEIPPGTDKKQRMVMRSQDHNSAGDISEGLNILGADNWELVSVVEARCYGGEILYTFKK